jgi:hypothetical protein
MQSVLWTEKKQSGHENFGVFVAFWGSQNSSPGELSCAIKKCFLTIAAIMIEFRLLRSYCRDLGSTIDNKLDSSAMISNKLCDVVVMWLLDLIELRHSGSDAFVEFARRKHKKKCIKTNINIIIIRCFG